MGSKSYRYCDNRVRCDHNRAQLALRKRRIRTLDHRYVQR